MFKYLWEVRIRHPADDGTVSSHEDIIVFKSQPIVIKTQCICSRPVATISFRSLKQSYLIIQFQVFSQISGAWHSLTRHSPIYWWDVFNADRQDDNACYSTFHRHDTGEGLSTHQPEQRGLIISLFICGEMIDAYQHSSSWLLSIVIMVDGARFSLGFPALRLLSTFLDSVNKLSKTSPCMTSTSDPGLFYQLTRGLLFYSCSDGKATLVASGYCHTHTDTH